MYIVAIAVESMCYGGPEEGGWWYNAGEPSTDSDHIPLMRTFKTEDGAYAYARMLNGTYVEKYNKEAYDFEYTSVCGGERITAEVWEDEYPASYYDYPGNTQRPRFS